MDSIPIQKGVKWECNPLFVHKMEYLSVLCGLGGELFRVFRVFRGLIHELIVCLVIHRQRCGTASSG
jgi:hypothetical protein